MRLGYLRDRKGRQRGIVVATDEGRIGWSLCRKSEKFNKEHGLDVAIARANDVVPQSLRKLVAEMQEKVEKKNLNALANVEDS